MGEAPLSPPGNGETRLRFLWLRSFDPGISIRVEHSAEATTLYAVELSGAGGYAPGQIAQATQHTLTPAQWREIERLLARVWFWQRRSVVEESGLDGARWVIEVSEPSRYHVVDRWSGNPLEPVGRHLLRLSGLDPNPIY